MRPRTRGLAALALLGVVAGSAALWLSRAPSAQDLPSGALRGYNVLLISIDTLRADRVGAYGSRAGLTPTFDRLAAEGLRFETAYAHVPLTLPSHATLLTGRVPPRNGVRDNGSFRLAADQPTLATRLTEAGYHTAAFVGAFVLDARFGLARGFDLYDDYYGERSTTGRVDVVERPAGGVTAPALAWIAKAPEPWFAWVHLYDPHDPYTPPEPYASQHAAAPYEGEIAYADAMLGRMLADLDRQGRLARTVVVLTADHGESLGEHGERTHGLFAYNSTLRVPLVVWCRNRIRPAVYEEAVGLIDVAPTLLDLLGQRADGMDGRSLRPLVARGRAAAAPPIYFEALEANLTRNWAPLTGIIANGLKLIDLPLPELYDLQADPAESTNVYARRGAEARRLEALLDRIAASPVTPGQVDAETRARLASLGYIVASPGAPRRKFTAEDDPKRLVDVNATLDDAVAIAGRGEVDRGIAMLRDAIRRRPDLTVAYDRLAFLLRSSGRATEAVDVLEEAASKGVADAPLLVSLGSALQEAGSLDRSASVLEAAAKLNPADLEARSRLAMTYAQQGRASEAERLFNEVLAADPHSSTALTNLGVLYLSGSRYDAAADVLRRALDVDPSAIGARNTLAVVYARRGDLPRAVAEWQQALSVDANQPDTLYNLGTALLQLGRTQEAVPVLERFVAVAPRPRYEADIAQVRQMLGRVQR